MPFDRPTATSLVQGDTSMLSICNTGGSKKWEETTGQDCVEEDLLTPAPKFCNVLVFASAEIVAPIVDAVLVFVDPPFCDGDDSPPAVVGLRDGAASSKTICFCPDDVLFFFLLDAVIFAAQ